MGGNSSLPEKSDPSKNKEHDRIANENGLCQNCHFLERHFSDVPIEDGSVVKAIESAETSERKLEIMQRQPWVPVVPALVFWGHSLLKVTLFYLLRCSWCGHFIFGLWEVAYSCQGCAIVCHSNCVININKSCHEIKSLIEDKKHGVDFQGHTFQKKFCLFRKCAKCKNVIITFLDKCLQCKDCKAVLHDSCIFLLDRICPSLYFSQGYKMISDAASLSSQDFKCPDCNTPIFDESEDCQYCYFTKKFFCHTCHRNKKAIIPERVLQQWCFCFYPVSDWSRIYLTYMIHQPVIEVTDLSRRVTSLNREIFNIIMLLEEMKKYYDYLPECQKQFDGILKMIRKKWPNLLRTPLNFSLSNLQEIFTSFQKDERNDNTLYPQLLKCHEKLVHHVRRDCRKCALHAQKCMVCDYKSSETTPENAIFYFERTVSTCKNKRCTPLNCVHRNCLRNNPLFICKGCDTRMVTDEELSSICRNFRRRPRMVRAKETIANPAPNKEGTERDYSENAFRKRIQDYIRESCVVADSLRTRANIPRISSDSDSEYQKASQYPTNSSSVNTDSYFHKVATSNGEILGENKQIMKRNLETYINANWSYHLKQEPLDSTSDQTGMSSYLYRHGQTDTAEVIDQEGAHSQPLERRVRKRHLQQLQD